MGQECHLDHLQQCYAKKLHCRQNGWLCQLLAVGSGIANYMHGYTYVVLCSTGHAVNPWLDHLPLAQGACWTPPEAA